MHRIALTFVIMCLFTGSAVADHCIDRMKGPEADIAAARREMAAAAEKGDVSAGCTIARKAEAAQDKILEIGQDATCYHAPNKPGPRKPNNFTDLVQKLCGATGAAAKPEHGCAPRATVISRSETTPVRSSYEVIVVDNVCPFKVKFRYARVPVSGGPTTEYDTKCVPANASQFEAYRSSDASMMKVRIVGNYIRCY